jgi:hypothetical protein
MYTKQDYLLDIKKIKENAIKKGMKVKYWHEVYKDILQGRVVKRRGEWLTILGENRHKKKVNIEKIVSCWYRGNEIVL